jgi:hypothetical protein
MVKTLTDSFKMVLNQPLVARVRRNHGLEHATLHILSQRFPGRSMAGHSDTKGFWIVGDLGTEDVQSVVDEALQRMKAGERKLAIHPNCGTNFVTSGILAGLAAFMAMVGTGRRVRDRLERIPLVMTLATLALIVAQPLGLMVHENVTTSADLGELEVVEIIPPRRNRPKAHRIITRS